jgi:ribosomal protein L36
VIFTGIDKHVTFVHKPDLDEILDIEIVDVVPPEPSWLASVVRRLEESGIFGDLTIRFTDNLTDLRQFEGENTVFPCSSSGLKGKCLDCDVIKEDGSLLVGCEISRELFESRFPGLEYSFINICPFKSDVFRPTRPFITRCCRSEKSGIVTINGIKGAVVHWGASEFYVADTIWKLVRELRGEN